MLFGFVGDIPDPPLGLEGGDELSGDGLLLIVRDDRLAQPFSTSGDQPDDAQPRQSLSMSGQSSCRSWAWGFQRHLARLANAPSRPENARSTHRLPWPERHNQPPSPAI
jgi:hypothetical protein